MFFQSSHLPKHASFCTQQRNRAGDLEEEKEGEGEEEWRKGGEGSLLFSMKAESSADLHRSRPRRAIGWRVRAGRGGPSWALQRQRVGIRAPPPILPRPRSCPAPSRRALAAQPAASGWRPGRCVRAALGAVAAGSPAVTILRVAGHRGDFQSLSGQPLKPRELPMGEEGAASFRSLRP